MLITLIFFAGLWAGLQNALAGGGSFVTLPVLILSGLSPLAANITSTVALFPDRFQPGLPAAVWLPVPGNFPSGRCLASAFWAVLWVACCC